MKEHKRTEEQQRDYIFDIFSKCHNETASSRLQVYFPTLCEQIYLWYRDYLAINIDTMGLEITKVINCFTNDENISKIPKDKDEFFKYLKTSIYIEKAGSYREYNENDTIRIPREIKRKRKEIEELIEMLESQLGRKSTSDEKIQFISKWKKVTDKKAIEYLELINNENTWSLDNNNGEESNILDTLDTEKLKKPLFLFYKKPDSVFFENIDISIIKEAVKYALEKRHEKVRDCYLALFTLFCINKDQKDLYPILDQGIIDFFHKNDIKPKQYEIYQKYHPNVQKSGAEAMASANLRDFLKDIDTYLKEKNQ